MDNQYKGKRRKAVVYPGQMKILEQLGQNIELAMKRRKITTTRMAERTGLSRTTVRLIREGSPRVSLGHYLTVLSILKLENDLANVAKNDLLGEKLDEIRLLNKSRWTCGAGQCL